MTTTTLDSYSETNYDSGAGIATNWNANGSSIGQTFKTPNNGITYYLKKCKFYTNKVAGTTGNIQAEVYAHTGTFGTNGKPTGAVLASSVLFDASTLGTSIALVEFTFSGANQIALTPNTPYCVVLTGISLAGAGIVLGCDASAPTHQGNYVYWGGGVWNSSVAFDCPFYVYGALVLTITAVDHVTTSPTEGTHDYASGEAVPVTATVDSGYFLHYWTLDTIRKGYLATYTVTMNTDHTLTAVIHKLNPLFAKLIRMMERA